VPQPDLKAIRAKAKSGGPITVQMKRREALAPASLKAELSYDGRKRQGEIIGLGLHSMFLRVKVAPRGYSERMPVTFELHTRGGTAVVKCICRIDAVDKSDTDGIGVDVHISSYDEGESKGLLKQYIRWLHFKALRG